MTEYIWDGTAWKLWTLRDASSLITVGSGWTVDAKKASVASGVATLLIVLTRSGTSWGPSAQDFNNGATITVDASLAWSIPAGITLAPAPANVTSGNRWNSFAWRTHPSGIALNFETGTGPYIAVGGWVHGVITWPIG